MPKLFEIFGYPLSDSSAEAKRHRQEALCPFMGLDCDGGGNRYLSHVTLRGKPALRSFFLKKKVVPAGVCSLQLHPGESPWVVCPRRLLTFKWADVKTKPKQLKTQIEVLKLLGLPSGTTLGVWPEVKFQYRGKASGVHKLFDYTFDYILAPIGAVGQDELTKSTTVEWPALKRLLRAGGYKILKRGKEEAVEGFLCGAPHIVEIMTSSTSGGNKTNRTTIPLAFEDAILGQPHQAPGVNYRQVWARMVSQLVVKSEVAMAWGGQAIWVVQDVLVDYINSTTGLNLDKLLAKKVSEVNMLCFSYGEASARVSGVLELQGATLYAGPISAAAPESKQPPAPSFQDMIRAPVCPPLQALMVLLAKRRPSYTAVVP